MGGIPVKRHYLEQKHLLKKCVQFLRQSMTDKNIARVHRQSLQLMKIIQKPLLDRRLKLSGGGGCKKKQQIQLKTMLTELHYINRV